MSTIDDQVKFLLARIAEDEVVAREASGRVAGLTLREPDGSIRYYDSTRILAESEAKRRVIHEVEATLKSLAYTPSGTGRLVIEYGVRAILRHLTVIYSTHPDFPDEWRVL